MTPGLELGWNIPELLDCALMELRVELTLAGRLLVLVLAALEVLRPKLAAIPMTDDDEEDG
jgi:hypothetical protein